MSAWAKVAELLLKLLAFLGLYRAGRKSEEARQDRETIRKVEEINEARSDNAARTDDELRDKLLRDVRQRRSR
jgi:hypothetical protein